MTRIGVAIAAVFVLGAGCTSTNAQQHPEESYVEPPTAAFSPEDYVFRPNQLVHFYDVPGEYGYLLEGKDYGFGSLSVIMTDTHPGGGPPLHRHDTEEAHIIQDGRYRVLIGDETFDVTGPAVVRIPAATPHTFVNTGDRVLHVIGILPEKTASYAELGPNPLLKTHRGGE